MPFLPRFRRKQNKKKDVHTLIKEELEPYIKHEDLEKYVKEIETDKKRKRLWESLSNRQKIKLLRYATSKKEAKHEKRKE